MLFALAIYTHVSFNGIFFMSILDINSLSISFSGEGGFHEVVHDVSFSLDRGSTLGIVGESGSGKSVTAQAIMGLLPIGQSKISGGGLFFNTDDGVIDLLKAPPRAMRNIRGNHISMVFQEPMTALNPVVPCGLQVAEVLIVHKKLTRKQARKEVLSWFSEVGLPDPLSVWRSYPHEISGGQKQRVMIAMAMACRPAVLIADEPTTALDVTVQSTILRLMRTLQERYHTSIIFITHDLGVITEVAHEVAVMYQGRIVEKGSVSDIFNHPRHPYTRGLIACRPPLDQRPVPLLTINDFLKNPDQSRQNTRLISQDERQMRHETIYKKAPVLQVNGLTKRFIKRNAFFKAPDYFTAVHSVSFKVYPGETLGLVGESGCGKTTLGRTLLRLLKATSGDILFENKSIKHLSFEQMRALRRSIQIIFQDPYASLNPGITIGQAIQEPMKVHGILKNNKERKEKTLSLLEKVGLEAAHYTRYPHEFSGGQRQRACIARALALNPRFIICDESVSALDVSVQAQVLNLLNSLREELAFTCIFISHDLSVVRYMCDRILVMKDGQIVEEEEADQLFTHPKNPYTRTLIQSIPGVNGLNKKSPAKL